jgi:HK97 family phage major capsid protein
MFRKLSEVQTDLQSLADQVGASRFEAVRKSYLASRVVTDEEGNPLAPDAIKIEEIVVKAAEPAEVIGSININTPDIAALVKAEVAKANAASKAAVAPKSREVSNALSFSTIEIPRGRSRVFKSAATAHDFGMWALAIAGRPRAQSYCIEKGYLGNDELHLNKVGIEGSNSLGGNLVPPEFESTIIDLKEKYGVFSQYADIWPMTRDTLTVPTRSAGLTAYAVGENDTITESDMTWGAVTLTARKWAVLTKTSSELLEDSVINLADRLAAEMAYAIANKEDDAGFNGTGTSTYHGINGIRNGIGSAGIVDALSGDDTYEEVELATCNAVVGALPEYAETANTAWYCSKKVFATIFQRLATAAGGVTSEQVQGGAPQKMFLGYPVRVSQVLPASAAASQICALFGDLTLSSAFGDRSGISVAMATQGDTDFAKDRVSWRCTRRFDIVNHSIGTSAVAGPVVALKLSA